MKWTIKVAAFKGNLEMLKYCFSNECPCDEEGVVYTSCLRRTPRLSSISFRQSETFARDGKRNGNRSGSTWSLDILKYFVEERKISDEVKHVCMCNATRYGRLDCLKYLLGEEAKTPPERLAIRRLRSVLRAPRVPKLLARKRVPGTNGRTIRSNCRMSTNT